MAAMMAEAQPKTGAAATEKGELTSNYRKGCWEAIRIPD